MKSFETFANSLRDAWGLVVDVRYPLASEEYEPGDPVWQAALIPFCGCVAGILLAALGVLLPSGVAGSLIWAFAALAVLILKDSGRSVKFISEKCAKLFFRQSAESFIQALNTAFILFRLAALFVIAYGGFRGAMILLLTSVFAVESYLAVNSPAPVIDIEDKERRYIWVVPAIAAFLTFWGRPLFTLVVILLSCGVVWYFRSRVWKEDYPVSGDDITFVSGIVELTLLTAAMLII